MSIRQLSVVLLTFASIAVVAAPADAAFGDWLFGRNTQPYVAGYAPTAQVQLQTYDNPSVYTGQPVYSANRAGFAPAATAYQLPPTGTIAPVSAWTPANPNQSYSAGFGSQAGFGAQATPAPGAAQPTPWTVTNTTVGPPVGTPPNAVSNFVAPQLATPRAVAPGIAYRPPFGRPNTGGEVPIARAFRGANTTSNPFYGTGNQYPSTFGAVPQPYASAYRSNQVALQPSVGATLNGPAVDPLFPNAPRPVLGGLSRFFSSLLGTNYRSSYYRAPITYYRPITAVDPVTGVAVAQQQACSSYVQQLQRTPYNSYQPGGGLLPGGFGNQGTTVTPIGQPTPCGPGGCGIANAAPQSYGQSLGQPFGSNSYAANPNNAPAPDFGRSNPFNSPQFGSGPFDSRGAIGQVGGTSSPNDRDVIPIPSTDPQSGYYQQNTRPLTGQSRTPSNGDDRDNVPQPRLESARPSSDTDTYRDGLYRSDAAPYADEDFQKREPVDQSSYYKPKMENETLDLNPPLSRNGYPSQQRYAPEPMGATEQNYTRLAPIVPKANFRTEQPIDRDDREARPASVPPSYSTARPIPDPEPSPFANRDRNLGAPQSNMNASDRYESQMQAPELPPATEQPASTDGWFRRGEASSASTRVTVPVREANLSLKQFQRKPAPAPQPAKSLQPILRDTEGWTPL